MCIAAAQVCGLSFAKLLMPACVLALLPALMQEPFGLTLIEAAAHGVPIVATCHGGPVDIVATLRNGVTVEPADVKGIATAITSIITSPDTWDTYSNNGRCVCGGGGWTSFFCVLC